MSFLNDTTDMMNATTEAMAKSRVKRKKLNELSDKVPNFSIISVSIPKMKGNIANDKNTTASKGQILAVR
jgi:hypothetical protein